MKKAILLTASTLSICAADFNIPVTYGRTGNGTFPAVAVPNYITGELDLGSGPAELRSYYVFDLSSVPSAQIVSATLDLRSGSWGAQAGPTETLGLFDVSSSTAALTAQDGSPTVFADLGSGLSYGQSILSRPASTEDRALLAFNATGVQALNSAIAAGEFKVGIALQSINTSGQTEFLLAGPGGGIQIEAITSGGSVVSYGMTPVPEPSFYATAAAVGLLGFAALRRARQ